VITVANPEDFVAMECVAEEISLEMEESTDDIAVVTAEAALVAPLEAVVAMAAEMRVVDDGY